eukprot:1153171-Pelagomonas_calceolata.AAC.9
MLGKVNALCGVLPCKRCPEGDDRGELAAWSSGSPGLKVCHQGADWILRYGIWPRYNTVPSRSGHSSGGRRAAAQHGHLPHALPLGGHDGSLLSAGGVQLPPPAGGTQRARADIARL